MFVSRFGFLWNMQPTKSGFLPQVQLFFFSPSVPKWNASSNNIYIFDLIKWSYIIWCVPQFRHRCWTPDTDYKTPIYCFLKSSGFCARRWSGSRRGPARSSQRPSRVNRFGGGASPNIHIGCKRIISMYPESSQINLNHPKSSANHPKSSATHWQNHLFFVFPRSFFVVKNPPPPSQDSQEVAA